MQQMQPAGLNFGSIQAYSQVRLSIFICVFIYISLAVLVLHSPVCQNLKPSTLLPITFSLQGDETAGESQQSFIPHESATRDESVSDDEKHELSDSESEGEETDEEERERRGEILQKVREEAEAKKQAEAEAKRKLTKKEQQALKAKELHDIDALMNEFGVANEEEKPAPLPVLVSSPKDEEVAESSAGGKKKKKKKKGKSTTVQQVDAPDESVNAGSVDVGNVMKSKMKKKGKTAAEKAAATAAKEEKAAKEAKAAKKKKKKKDKYTHGAPTR